MSQSFSWDSAEQQDLAISYNRIERELSDMPRFVRGKNTYVTSGKKISRRPGTLPINSNNGLAGYRVDRLYPYETLDSPPAVYIVLSVYNIATQLWELWWQRETSTPVPFVSAGAYRDINLSTRPHEAVVSRGLLFVKGYPAASSSEKLGTVIFDGTGGTVVIHPWGALGPVVPATLANSAVGNITTPGGISPTDASIDVDITDGTLPAAPFVVQIDFEQIEVGASTGTTGAVTFSSLTRAFNGTVAEGHAEGAPVLYRGWAVSAHPIQVNQFWEYAFAWKTITGQYTNRSPTQTNPDLLPSRTGPFFNQIPQITVQGHADTINITDIGIFRTTDGGGTFFFLEDIPNSGAGNITYTDDSLTSNAGNMDPLPDVILDTEPISPSLTSNSPAPTVLAPLITGVDTPSASTPLASFQSRIWMGIGNVLFFSGEEEITLGVPEECWPSGLRGNFFRFQYPITNVRSTTNYLYVMTLQATYIVSGSNLQTFSVQPILDNIGHPYGHPRAIDHYRDKVIWLTQDYRIILVSDANPESPQVLTDPLFTDIVDAINAGAEFDIKYFGDLDKELIFAAGHNDINPVASRQWVFDIKRSEETSKPFWNLPWDYPSSCLMSGRISETTSQRRLVLAGWDTTLNSMVLARIDPTLVTALDTTPAGTVTYDVDMVYALTRVPAGDHVNQRRVPRATPVVYSLVFDRTSFAGDDDPSFFYFTDDFWTDPIAVVNPEDPARRAPSKSYKTIEYPVFQVANRVAWELSKLGSGDRFELQNFIVTFSPDAGI